MVKRTKKRGSSLNNSYSPTKITEIRRQKYITSVVDTYFSPKLYLDTVYIFDDKTIQHYIRTKIHKDQNVCVVLIFDDKIKDLYIDQIDTCSINGNTILKKSKQISTQLKYKTIRLYDTSHIYFNNTKPDPKCKLSLSTYRIMLYGESWYNKYGFKSLNHSEEVETWDVYRKLPFIETFYMFLAKEKTIDFNTNSWDGKMKRLKTQIEQQEAQKETFPEFYKLLSDEFKSIQSITRKDYNEFMFDNNTIHLLEYDILSFINNYSINMMTSTHNVFKEFEKIRLKTPNTKKGSPFYCGLAKVLNLFQNHIAYTRNLIYLI
tara:strand:- start:143 stop:1099 length:957 start_codon:yes stop_codon:yes gene_type:complete